jgi:hypothetical protein
MRTRSSLAFHLMVLLLGSSGGLMARGKFDVISLRNGDTITGEILSLSRGILSVKTEFMGTVSVEWRGVQRIVSPQTFELEVGNGVRYEGSLSEPAQAGQLAVETGAQGAVPLSRPEVVRIRTLDRTFFDRLDGEVDFGFNLTRANKNTTYNLNTELKYRAEEFTSSAYFSSFLTSQQDLETQTRNVLSVTHEQFMNNRYFGLGLGQFQQNEELGLDLRSAVGAGVGRYLVQNNRVLFSSGAGAAYTHEKFVDTDPESNAVSFGFLGLDFFQYEGSKRDLSVDLLVWPSLTDFGRVRIDLNASMRFEIVRNLKLGFTFWNNYDSRPPTADSLKNDYGLSTTIGYSF